MEGAPVTLELEDGVLKVIPARRRFTLAELLQDETPPGEHDWGEAKGGEAW